MKKFREQPHDEDQAKHTFRELILGAFIASHGHSVESKRLRIDGKTPDWSIVENSELKCIIEAVTFHNSKASKDAAIAREYIGTSGVLCISPTIPTGFTTGFTRSASSIKRDRPKSQSASLTLFMSSCEGLAFCLGFGLRECRAHLRLEQVPEVVARQFQTQVLIRT